MPESALVVFEKYECHHTHVSLLYTQCHKATGHVLAKDLFRLVWL